MLKFLEPHYYFKKYSDVTPEFLIANNISAVLLDVDNTLAPYELSKPDDKVLFWLDSLKLNGIKFAFISNNPSNRRIKVFNENIGAPAFARSGKPFAKKKINKALNTLGAQKENTVFMGDQILTDVLAGKIYGIRTILVPPIKDKKNLFFKLKRLLERPVLNNFFKRHKRT